MTDKEYKIQKTRVQKFIDKWFKPIGMGWWQVDMEWNRIHAEESPTTIAITNCNWQYRTGRIEFFLPTCADLNDDQLEEAIIHEFCHILVAPLQDLRDDQSREITEHTVTTLARTIIWARLAGGKK